ncbi:MAG: ribonuclease III [Candidatus Kerfeldbacteria bacterium CG_4_10_14_0_8_um_filter_42_10]|uniref:Ribonuclease 3 n=1 Tax=Candidatus Kerfeldbacteria bacterium CG_4_10_14_0_8_um_filter_42_10 TaxID=2014248 RepID=A0A2M7RJU7_9BACT|nr:MAG: ribonuclease III [Candidatus Kerfeldbacteria bacterium CG_4_10_14_0_8_um_filter_42_10]
MKDFSKLEEKLDIKFSNIELLRQALVHRSYLNEHPRFPLGHNERLEFLGDAVLELVVTEYLYKNYPRPEGELTNWRASLVKSEQLAKVAEGMSIIDYLFLSKGESQDKTPKARQTIMANTLEAVIGAIFLDQGMKTAEKFIKKNIIIDLENILANHLYDDPKSRFQEISQEKTGITPVYKVIKENGPDHKKVFTVGVWLENELVAEGEGPSKQAAQVEAAKSALKTKGW